jgi:pyridoxamine 5'-phosphate oxidase
MDSHSTTRSETPSAAPAAPGRPSLSEDQVAGEPMTQFARWMSDAMASDMPEPTAMVLSTVTAEGRPRARTVLLKAHDGAGFTFYTNRSSRKGGELAANPSACLLFPWYRLQRQVIAEGTVRALSQAESEDYFRSRPRGSQIGAWASRQSTVIPSRDVLDGRFAELQRRWPEPEQVPMPDFWGGYLLEPDAVEFWQAGVFRLHDRLRYRRAGDGWAVDRLSP